MGLSVSSSLALGATISAFQAGRVRNVIAVGFSRGPVVQPPRIVPVSAHAQAQGQAGNEWAASLAELLGKELEKTHTLLSDALGGQDVLARYLSEDMAGGLPEDIPQLHRIAIETYRLGQKSLEALRAPAETLPVLDGESRAIVVDAAIIAQVDARLEAEAALQEIELQTRLSVVTLFAPDNAELFEKGLRLGQMAERNTRRKSMIADLRQEVKHGVVTVSIATARVSDSTLIGVVPAEGQAITTFSGAGYEITMAIGGGAPANPTAINQRR